MSIATAAAGRRAACRAWYMEQQSRGEDVTAAGARRAGFGAAVADSTRDALVAEGVITRRAYGLASKRRAVATNGPEARARIERQRLDCQSWFLAQHEDNLPVRIADAHEAGFPKDLAASVRRDLIDSGFLPAVQEPYHPAIDLSSLVPDMPPFEPKKFEDRFGNPPDDPGEIPAWRRWKNGRMASHLFWSASRRMPAWRPWLLAQVDAMAEANAGRTFNPAEWHGRPIPAKKSKARFHAPRQQTQHGRREIECRYDGSFDLGIDERGL